MNSTQANTILHKYKRLHGSVCMGNGEIALRSSFLLLDGAFNRTRTSDERPTNMPHHSCRSTSARTHTYHSNLAGAVRSCKRDLSVGSIGRSRFFAWPSYTSIFDTIYPSLRFLGRSIPSRHICYTSVRQISMYSQIWRCVDWNRPDRFLSSPFRFWYRLGRMACVLGRGTLVQYS